MSRSAARSCTRRPQLLRERADRIATTLTQEQGKPLAEAKGEVMASSQLFDWYAEDAKRDYGRTLVRPAGQLSRVIRQPVGPTATFTPWNFPIYLLAKKVSAALAAGCTVISRPPHETPGCCTELFRALADAGIPNGVAQLVHGDSGLISETLIASRVIRKVSFTGSTNVGKHLMRLCADSMTRVTMELGGHAPVLIFDDCDLEKTLDMVVPQKFRNAGQVCVSPTRFYVQSGIYDAFVKGFAERTAKVKVGSGLDADTQMGPLANKRRPDAIEALVEDAKAKGARVLAGGERGDGGFFFQPTLLADVPNEAQIMNDEPFGPVAVVAPVRHVRGSDRAGQPPPLRPRRLRLHRKRPPREPHRRPRRKRHGRHQHLRHQRRRHAVRRGEGFRLRQRGRERGAGELSGREGDSPGLSRRGSYGLSLSRSPLPRTMVGVGIATADEQNWRCAPTASPSAGVHPPKSTGRLLIIAAE